MKLTVYGSRGSFPVCGKQNNIIGQDTSCYVIKEEENALIIDCGSGLISAVENLKDCKNIDIILSHVHYDHIMGLFETRDFFIGKNVDFYGDFSSWEEEEEYEHGSLYKIENIVVGNIHDIKIGQQYKLKTGYSITFRRSIHQNDTCMVKIEKDGKTICFTGDYEHKAGSGIEKWASDCDLLLFDGSYSKDDYFKYMGWGHSMYEDGCSIASKAKVKKLLVTHFAPQYNDDILLANEENAKTIFKETYFAKQNESYEV